MNLDDRALQQLGPIEGLIYTAGFDSSGDAVTLTIEIEPEYHKDLAEAVAVNGVERILLDFRFSGVVSFSFWGLLAAPTSRAEDEPPHEYEIAVWRVSKPLLGHSRKLEVSCHAGPSGEISFEQASVEVSRRAVGVVHDYGSPLGPGVKIETRKAHK